MTPRWKRWLLGDRRRPVVRLWALVVPVIVLLAAVPLLRPVRSTAGPDNTERLLIATARAVAERGTLVLAYDPTPLVPFPIGPDDSIVVPRSVEDQIFGVPRAPVRLNPTTLPAPGIPSTTATDSDSKTSAGAQRGVCALDPRRADEPRTIDGVSRAGDRLYARQPPVVGWLFGALAWAMGRAGVSLGANPEKLAGLLTFFGATLPVALAGGLLYRMGRVFEISRAARAGLALACVFAGGGFADAVVLGPRGPATAAAVGAVALVIHLGASRRPVWATVWMPLCGIAAGVAAMLEPAALLLLVVLPLAVALMRHPLALRLTAGGLLLVGMAGPIGLHMQTDARHAGGLRWPAFVETSRGPHSSTDAWLTAGDENESADTPPAWPAVGRFVRRVASATLGGDGWVVRFPVLLLGVAGVILMLHRHWTGPLKVLAGGTLLGAAGMLALAGLGETRVWAGVFAPLLVFWAGAWARRPHRTATWVVAGALVAFSTVTTFLAVFRPVAPEDYKDKTAPVVVAGRW